MYQVSKYSGGVRGYSDIKYITTDNKVELPESRDGYKYTIRKIDHKDELHLNKCSKIYALVEISIDWSETTFCSYLSDSVSDIIINGSKYHTGYDNQTYIWEYEFDANTNNYFQKNSIAYVDEIDQSYDILHLSDKIVDLYLTQDDKSIYNKRIKDKKEDELHSTSSDHDRLYHSLKKITGIKIKHSRTFVEAMLNIKSTNKSLFKSIIQLFDNSDNSDNSDNFDNFDNN